jgi:integrase
VANYRFPASPLKAGTVGDMLANYIQSLPDPMRDADHPDQKLVGSAHWLRHSHAYLALAAAEGTNLEEVRESLGHTDSRQTRLYGNRYQWPVRRKVTDLLPDPEGQP